MTTRRPPAFWSTPDHPLSRLLAPLGAVAGTIAAQRMAREPVYRSPLPVVCIGNLVVGGQGKTPLALAVAEALRARGHAPVFLTRGYGGRLRGPVRATAAHTARDVGDEPLLLAREAPCIVARDRVAGAKLAEAFGSDDPSRVIVMDDGFQNPALAKTLSLIAVDAGFGLGNGRVLPAGPLRMPVEVQLERANALVVIGPGDAAYDLAAMARAKGVPVLSAQLRPEPGLVAPGEPIVAFAGIGRPEKFFATLRTLGADLRETHAYPDHHRFTAEDARWLLASAERHDARLMTTSKDKMRLTSAVLVRLDTAATALPVRLAMTEDDALGDVLSRNGL